MSLLDGTIQITKDELIRNGWRCVQSTVKLPPGAVKETLAFRQVHYQRYTINCYIVKIEQNIVSHDGVKNINTWAIFVPALELLQYVDDMHDIDIFICKSNLSL